MPLGTSEVTAVLRSWVNGYLEDVPARHVGGEYLIEYATLVQHINELSYDNAVAVMIDALEELKADNDN